MNEFANVIVLTGLADSELAGPFYRDGLIVGKLQSRATDAGTRPGPVPSTGSDVTTILTWGAAAIAVYLGWALVTGRIRL